MSDRTLLLVALAFVIAVIVLGALRNPIVQVLDTVFQGVRLVD